MKYALFTSALLCLTPSCFIDARDDDGYQLATGDGVLIVDWTIQGAKDPVECQLSDADSISVLVDTAFGNPVGEFTQACEAFSMSITLPPGDYAGDAVLLDSTGRERTTAAPIGGFPIYGGDELLVPVDFPVRSFY